MRTGKQLLEDLIEFDRRCAYGKKVTIADRNLLNELINFLNHMQIVDLLSIFDRECAEE